MSSCITDNCGTGDWTGPLPGDPDNNSILSAVPAFGGIDVSWTYPNINPHAVAHVLLYRGITSNYAASVKQATVAGNTFYDRITGTAGTRYYYWIQIVSVNGTVGTVIGPASAIARSRIEDTIIDLSGKIEESALGTALRGSIEDITDNYNELTGSIAAFTGNNAAFMAALSGVQTGLTGALTLLNTEVTQRTSGQNALLSQQTVLAALNQVNVAAILEEQTVRVSADSALAQTVVDLGVANTAGIASAVKTLESSKIGYSGKASTEEPYEGNGSFIVYPVATYPTATFPDYAINRKRIIDKQGVTNWNAGNALQLVWVVGMPLAQAIKSVGISDGTDYLTVEQRATAQKLTNGTLLGKYTVKIDQGGRVAGYGLASSTNLKDGTTSAFAVNADTFSVSRPLSYSRLTTPPAASTVKGQTWFNESDNKIYKATATGVASWILDVPKYPFIVDTVSGEVLIDNAVIKKLNSDSIDTKGLSIYSSSGVLILDAGKTLQSQLNPYTSGATVGADWNTNISNKPTIPNPVDISGKLDKASTAILGINASDTVCMAGIRVGDIVWGADGKRTSGKGLALTPTGILGHNGKDTTFAVDATTGDATFGGTLTAAAVDAVDTLNIKGNAVTVPVAVGQGEATGNGSFQLIGQFALTLNQAGKLLVGYSGLIGYSSGIRTAQFKLDIDATAVYTSGENSGSFNVSPSLVYMTPSALAAGSHTVKLYFKGQDSTVTCTSGTIYAMGIQR